MNDKERKEAIDMISDVLQLEDEEEKESVIAQSWSIETGTLRCSECHSLDIYSVLQIRGGKKGGVYIAFSCRECWPKIKGTVNELFFYYEPEHQETTLH